MDSHRTWQSSLLCLLQVALLGYFYTYPTDRVLNGWLYFALLTTNSLLLTWLAYRAFQAQRPIVGVVATVLAFPGLFAGVVAVVFLLAKH